jgi:hypothetical protein
MPIADEFQEPPITFIYVFQRKIPPADAALVCDEEEEVAGRSHGP